MQFKEKELRNGIKVHLVKTEKFKTNIIAVFFTLPITRDNVTKNALISTILRRGCQSMPTSTQINQELEEMYGATFDNGLEKTGNNHILKFYLESINDKFLPQPNENMLKESIEKLLEITLNPVTENGGFKKEYVNQEKENIRRIIEGKADNKARYAFDRCVEEMYKNEPYGLYRYGYIEDLEHLDEKNLFEYYEELKNNSKIDIYISGDISEQAINFVEENENIKKLAKRNVNYIIKEVEEKPKVKEKVVIEKLDVTQGKIIIGLDVHLKNSKQKYATLLYNAILGGTANSKMFQEVREKASLAYTASSNYIRYKSNIFINCGIEIKNYDKAINIIKKQLEDMKNGIFTDEDIENSKSGIISTIKSIKDEQDSEIMFYFGQELTDNKITIEQYIEEIEKVTKENIVEIANLITINTVYFLRNLETSEEGQE